MQYLQDQKANLMNNNHTHSVRMEFDLIERMIAKKTAQAGNLTYKYPGQLEESDEEYNAGDLEDFASNSLSEDN